MAKYPKAATIDQIAKVKHHSTGTFGLTMTCRLCDFRINDKYTWEVERKMRAHVRRQHRSSYYPFVIFEEVDELCSTA